MTPRRSRLPIRDPLRSVVGGIVDTDVALVLWSWTEKYATTPTIAWIEWADPMNWGAERAR